MIGLLLPVYRCRILFYLDDLRADITKGVTVDLLGTMKNLIGTHATDPRDKLYSILGLVPEHLREIPITIDYTKDCKEILYDFTKRQLLASDHMDMLCMATGTSWSTRADRSGMCPSWVVNPSPHYPRNPRDRLTWSIRHLSFKATKGSKSRLEFEGDMLGLQGHAIHAIVAVGSAHLRPCWLASTTKPRKFSGSG